MLITIPLDKLTFADVEAFCIAWPEGVRVEYKSRLVAGHIPKVISSFANTVGGIWLIGVTTDESNRPLPIKGFPREAGIEERITQSCYQNLYPPLLPEVAILEVPNEPGNVVVLVRVHESIDAPHAIENTTKVYIRTNSTTERIELAQIDRVDYLLRRRREAEQKREEMLLKLGSFSRFRNKLVRLRIGPQYPHRPVLTLEEMTQRVKTLPDGRLGQWVHPIRDGYLAPSPFLDTFVDRVYFAANFYGMIVYEEPIEILRRPDRTDTNFIELNGIVSHLTKGLSIAKSFLLGTATNLKADVVVEGIKSCTLSYQVKSYRNWIDWQPIENVCTAETSLLSEQLQDVEEINALVVELVCQLMWQFNWQDRKQIETAVRSI